MCGGATAHLEIFFPSSQFFRRLPVPFRHEEDTVVLKVDSGGQRTSDLGINMQGVLNISSTFDSRTCEVESSLVSRGNFWRVKASRGSSTSASENPSLFLVQLGPQLFVRESTLLLPLHLSKQNLLWYGYDRKHRRWLLMSMICLNPLACSFMNLQFPNGQLIYVASEGLSTSAFLPVFGGLLQAQGQYPGQMRFSFSSKVSFFFIKRKYFNLLLLEFMLCYEVFFVVSGLIHGSTMYTSLHPTFGGSNPRLKAELVHSVNENLNLIGGCSLTSHPSAFVSLSLGRSKWNENIGKSEMVLKVETPLGNVGQPSFSVQLNSGIEF
ncbi:hypothetical protein R6Q59_004969 [Mikania micrantha]